MITPSSISYISEMLNEPQNLSEADIESITAIKESFPYFVPSRYMDAATQHQENPFSTKMMSDMQLYMGNWLLYNQFLRNALGDRKAELTEVPQHTISAKEEVEETELEQHEQEEEVVAEIATPTVETEVEEEPIIEEKPQVTETNEIVEPQEEVTEDAGFDLSNTDFIKGDNYTESVEQEETEEEVEEENEEPTPLVNPKLEANDDDNFILPVYTEDYFLHQGMHVSNNIPDKIDGEPEFVDQKDEDPDKSLMVVMSFSEWLSFYKKKKKVAEEEEEGQRALKTMWQKEKLAAALEEEDDEIPENVFEMAVNSISKEDGLVSESLANVLVKQGRYDKAIDMYKKLSLRNPQKKAYFARKIEILLKEK